MIRTISLFLFSYVISFVSYAQQSPSIIDDDFANKPFGKDLSPENAKEIMHGNVDYKQKPIKNKFTDSFDTLLIFSSNDAELIFYKNFEKVFFKEAVIVGRGINLAKGIKVGMSKGNFMKAFGIKTSPKEDLFVIKNSTEYANHKFHFKNNNLIKIELDAGMD